MTEGNSTGPSIDFDQVDIRELPPQPKPVIDWNDKKRRYRCSSCKKRKMFPQGPVFRDADNDFQIVCSDCAGKYAAPGLDALLSLGRMAMNENRSTIWVLDGLSLHLKEYREAVELIGQA
jgi:DNA-directed RNA polymerase subunit RPC12/RpoP